MANQNIFKALAEISIALAQGFFNLINNRLQFGIVTDFEVVANSRFYKQAQAAEDYDHDQCEQPGLPGCKG